MGENIRRKKMSFHCHFRKISFHVISGKENVFSLSFHENLISFPFISCHFRKRKTEKEKEKEGEQYLWKNNIFRRSWRTEKEKEESTRSSGLNCAFWDDEAVYWVSIVQQYGWHLVVLSQYKVVLVLILYGTGQYRSCMPLYQGGRRAFAEKFELRRIFLALTYAILSKY